MPETFSSVARNVGVPLALVFWYACRVRHPARVPHGPGGPRRRPGGDPGRAPQPAQRPAHRPRAVGSVTGRAGIYRAGCVTRRAGAEDGAAVDTPGTRRHPGVFLVTVEALSTIVRRTT